MRFILNTCILLTLFTSIYAEDMAITVGDGTAYTFKYPDTITATKNSPPDGIPPTIKAKSINGKMSLQITFIPKGKIAIDSQAGVNGIVEKIGSGQYQNGSVENKTVITELKVTNGLGAIAQYTDADLVNVAETKPGQYKVVAAGVIVLGGNLATVTLLGDSFDSADYKQGITLLESGFNK
jgi:hypothetical protein